MLVDNKVSELMNLSIVLDFSAVLVEGKDTKLMSSSSSMAFMHVEGKLPEPTS